MGEGIVRSCVLKSWMRRTLFSDRVFNGIDDSELNTHRREVSIWFEEIWKGMRQATASEVKRRKCGKERLQFGDLVYI